MSDTPSLSPSALEASRAFRAVIGRVRRRMMSAAETEDITLAQAAVLARLADRPGVTASDLAADEGVRHQSMTATVAALAARGLVARAPDPDDGRRLLITLTDEGRRQVDEGRRTRKEWLARQLQERCTEDERHTVIAALTVLERLTHD